MRVAERAQAQAAIVTIGDELLSGEVANSNGPWLARELEKLGIRPVVIATVPDAREAIGAFVGWTRRQCDVVIVTGGLGGTPDDVTRPAVADAFAVECSINVELMHAFAQEGGYSALFAAEWSRLPLGARVIVGAPSAVPAFALGNVYVLPGVPAEMRAAFRSLRWELPSGAPRNTWRSTYATTEDQLAPLLDDLARRFPAVGVGSYPRYAREGPEVELVLRALHEDAVATAASHIQAALAASGIEPRRPRRGRSEAG